MKEENVLFWFKKDLRASDNQAFYEATKYKNILPIYIVNDQIPEKYQLGSASQWWLHHSLLDLQKSLYDRLNIYKGDPLIIIPKLVKQYNITNVIFNQCYESWNRKIEQKLQKILEKNGVNLIVYNDSLLIHPEQTFKKDGTFYKVFTPFYKNIIKILKLSEYKKIPFNKVKFIKDTKNKTTIKSLKLVDKDVDKKLSKYWNPTQIQAQKQLKKFIKNGLKGYEYNRNIPSVNGTSLLSPYLHFGQISIKTVWSQIAAIKAIPTKDKQCFLKELCWREFCYNLLYNFESLHCKNFKSKFDNFAWKNNKKLLTAWQEGQTGYPLVDAGMRQLLQTGYMHNRVRMVVASFLIKNLNISWHQGSLWFLQHLVDADIASNSANWQWVAGSGADAAPFFRIFNPTIQAKKFDPQAEYIKKYVPELKKLPMKYIFEPSVASEEILKKANIILGKNYPFPVVDLKDSRQKALFLYNQIK